MDKEKIIEQVEKEIDCIVEEGIQMSNLDSFGKLIDIHKDLKNEKYWKIKEEVYENDLQKSRRIWQTWKRWSW